MYDAIWAMRWDASLSARAATLVVIFGFPVAGWSYQERGAEYVFFAGRRRSQCSRDDEIDFALWKAQLHVIRVFRVVGCESFRYRAESRCEISEKLRIVYEDVYVLAQAMTMPEHEDCAAAKGPSVYRNLASAGVLDQLECMMKEYLPCP